jgi:hypothetical protein
MKSTSDAVSVQEAAVRLGRSERTVWRQIRSGALRSRREGRRVVVLLELPSDGDRTPRGLKTAEAAAPYGIDREWRIGPFPYTPAVVRRHERARLVRRRAAAAAIRGIAARVRPAPEGLTGADYIRADRDEPRALGGPQRGDHDTSQ